MSLCIYSSAINEDPASKFSTRRGRLLDSSQQNTEEEDLNLKKREGPMLEKGFIPHIDCSARECCSVCHVGLGSRGHADVIETQSCNVRGQRYRLLNTSLHNDDLLHR